MHKLKKIRTSTIGKIWRAAALHTSKPNSFDRFNEKIHKDCIKSFSQTAKGIYDKHNLQDEESVKQLNEKYKSPSIGKFTVYEALQTLGSYIDPTDSKLVGCSQQLHILQILDQMEKDKTIENDELFQASILHDLGKILFLAEEKDENIVCMNLPISSQTNGIVDTSLDNTVFQWNHDEFGYLRLREHVSPRVAWLIRYHSIRIKESKAFMNAHDLELTENLLLPFRKYDFGSKSPFYLPEKKLSYYKERINSAFPHKIWF